jgi:hypothetical protein
LAIRRGIELNGTGLPERHPVRVSVLKALSTHYLRCGESSEPYTEYLFSWETGIEPGPGHASILPQGFRISRCDC